jgi:hypothetical protein
VEGGAKESGHGQEEEDKGLFHHIGFDGDHKFAAKIQKKGLRSHCAAKITVKSKNSNIVYI